MLKRFISIYLMLLFTLVLGGCASNATFQGMADNRHSMQAANNKKLINNVGVRKVGGGHDTNPLWVSKINNPNYLKALELSLQNAKLHKFQSSRYELLTDILRQDQDLFGLNLTVLLNVHYQLKDRIEHKIIYNKVIKTSFTAKFSDSAIAMIRLRLANEGAARENIKVLINDLLAL